MVAGRKKLKLKTKLTISFVKKKVVKIIKFDYDK
jgi:hypothetical protein